MVPKDCRSIPKHSYMGLMKPSTAFKISSSNAEQLLQIEQLLPQFGLIRILNKSQISSNGYLFIKGLPFKGFVCELHEYQQRQKSL